MSILVRPATATPAGQEATALRLSVSVYHERPFDPSRYVGPVLYGVVALVAVLAVLRRVRPWQWRITRATS